MSRPNQVRVYVSRNSRLMRNIVAWFATVNHSRGMLKTFDLPVFLTANAGRIVSMDEIFNFVCENKFVEEANLPVQISALRKALRDQKDAPRFFVPEPDKGYNLSPKCKRPTKNRGWQSSKFVI